MIFMKISWPLPWHIYIFSENKNRKQKQQTIKNSFSQSKLLCHHQLNVLICCIENLFCCQYVYYLCLWNIARCDEASNCWNVENMPHISICYQRKKSNELNCWCFHEWKFYRIYMLETFKMYEQFIDSNYIAHIEC